MNAMSGNLPQKGQFPVYEAEGFRQVQRNKDFYNMYMITSVAGKIDVQGETV